MQLVLLMHRTRSTRVTVVTVAVTLQSQEEQASEKNKIQRCNESWLQGGSHGPTVPLPFFVPILWNDASVVDSVDFGTCYSG